VACARTGKAADLSRAGRHTAAPPE
jgi:hypothetical protein